MGESPSPQPDPLDNVGFVFFVVNDHRILLGRVRRSALDGAEPAATVENVMEAGPSTVRFNTPAGELVQRLAERDLRRPS